MDELLKKLKSFDLPSHRKTRLNKVNLKWLTRNIAIRNSQNPNLEKVTELIKEGIDQGGYE